LDDEPPAYQGCRSFFEGASAKPLSASLSFIFLAKATADVEADDCDSADVKKLMWPVGVVSESSGCTSVSVGGESDLRRDFPPEAFLRS